MTNRNEFPYSSPYSRSASSHLPPSHSQEQYHPSYPYAHYYHHPSYRSSTADQTTTSPLTAVNGQRNEPLPASNTAPNSELKPVANPPLESTENISPDVHSENKAPEVQSSTGSKLMDGNIKVTIGGGKPILVDTKGELGGKHGIGVKADGQLGSKGIGAHASGHLGEKYGLNVHAGADLNTSQGLKLETDAQLGGNYGVGAQAEGHMGLKQGIGMHTEAQVGGDYGLGAEAKAQLGGGQGASFHTGAHLGGEHGLGAHAEGHVGGGKGMGVGIGGQIGQHKGNLGINLGGKKEPNPPCEK